MNLYFWGLLGIYLISMIIIGYRRPSGQTMQSFFFADRRVSGFILTASTFATIIGATSTIGLIGLSVRWGLPAWWWLLSGSIGLIMLRHLFIRRLTGFGLYTVTDLIRHLYNPKIEKLSAGLILLSWTGVIAAQLVASGKLLRSLIPNFPLPMAITIIALVIVIYLLTGGQRAVLITDLIQALLIFLGVIVIFGFLVSHTSISSIPSDFFRFPFNQQAGPMSILSLCLILIPLYLFGPDIYSRFLCADSPRQASRVLFAAAALILIIGALLCLIGILGRSWYPGADGETIIYLLIKHHFNPVFGSLILLAFLAAFMSSADTSLMTSATILSHNMLHRFNLSVTRLFLILMMTLSVLIACFYQNIIASLMIGYKIFSAGLTIPLLLPLLFTSHRFSSFSASITLSWGALIAIFQEFYPLPLPGIINLSSSLILFILAEIIHHRLSRSRLFSSWIRKTP
ncbi:MAG: sodium:solute symporter family protein [Candidatus Delongbacteria bacterium]|nr:sodium:solute symporter family protein [Candidatus Delongbacteria bacterium]